jgi:26S proteasome regulatory subunit T6
MATVAVEVKKPALEGEKERGAVGGGGEGLRQYYLQHIHDFQLQVRQKTHNLQRLEAQRNDLNSKGLVFDLPI